MVRLYRHWLLVILFLAGASLSPAASSEDNAFEKAARKFNTGLWEFAAQDFGAFVTNFPTSFRIPEAILYQGEALIKNGRFTAGIALLSTNQYRAGDLGDLYLYWIAHGQLGNSNYTAAAQAFGQLIQNFPASTNRLDAAVAQAAALAKLEKWGEVAGLLSRPNGVFQSIAAASNHELVARGYLLLGEAELKLGNTRGASAAVAALDRFSLAPEPGWQRWSLQTRIEIAEGRLDEARRSSTNLVALAQAAQNSRLRGESYRLIAGIFEKQRQFEQAILFHQENLTTNVPVSLQRAALLKIAELSLAQNTPATISNAVTRLEHYRNDFPNAEAADAVLLTLGELQLKQATAGAKLATNQVLQARNQFNLLLANFPESRLYGRAALGKGWSFWFEAQEERDRAAALAGAEAAFRLAAERLGRSDDQATARFKVGDCQFLSRNFEGALATYRQLVQDYSQPPDQAPALLEQALYQAIRAALAVTNLTAASDSMQQLLAWYPNGFLTERSLFLVAEGYAGKDDTTRARELLIEFQDRYGSDSNALLPQVRLAISRTYEKEGNWNAAITNYDGWIAAFTNHVLLPEARFARAWDTAMSGSETNALALFNEFVQDFPNHSLAPRAKWWIGDYYFRRGDNAKAEENYPYTTNYVGFPDLYFPAHMRAGMAAMARFSYKDAISYFTALISNPKCPPDLKAKAAIAAGDAFLSRNEPGATNRIPDLEEARDQFQYVIRTFPASPQVPVAWGRLGDCYKEMGAANPKFYKDAIDAYTRVATWTNASSGIRRQAKVGLGIVALARAESRPADEQQPELKEAWAHFADAFADELQADDPDDVFWYVKAGLENGRMAERFEQWTQALNIYRTLQTVPNLSPAFQARLNRGIDRAREQSMAARANP